MATKKADQTALAILDEPRPALEIIPRPPTAPVTPMDMLNVALSQGADLAKLEQLMALQERWEANEARKAFYEAMAEFRAEGVRVFRTVQRTDGPLKGQKYAALADFVGAASASLSKFGLSASWEITRDEAQWIEIACIIAHRAGHTEKRVMGGPPDTGPARSPIQARSSTVSYLERLTFKMALGLAEEGEDTDGASSSPEPPQAPADYEEWKADMRAVADEGVDALKAAWARTAPDLRQHATMVDSAWWDSMKHLSREATATAGQQA
jgi:hypothetical protein